MKEILFPGGYRAGVGDDVLKLISIQRGDLSSKRKLDEELSMNSIVKGRKGQLNVPLFAMIFIF